MARTSQTPRKSKALLQYFSQERFGPRILRIAQHLSGWSFFHDQPGIHEKNPVRHFSSKTHFMADHNHGHTFYGEGFHNIEDLSYHLWSSADVGSSRA